MAKQQTDTRKFRKLVSIKPIACDEKRPMVEGILRDITEISADKNPVLVMEPEAGGDQFRVFAPISLRNLVARETSEKDGYYILEDVKDKFVRIHWLRKDPTSNKRTVNVYEVEVAE